VKGYVEVVTGVQGGGKSLTVIERAYDHVKKGGYFATTIEVFPEEWRKELYQDGYIFEPSRLIQLEGGVRDFETQLLQGTDEMQVMVALDEIHLSHHARDWQDTSRAQRDLVTLIRKLNIILEFITQDMSNMDKQFRKMCVRRTHCINLSGQKWLGIIPTPPVCFRIQHLLSDGHSIHSNKEMYVLPKKYFKLYNTKQLMGEQAQKFGALKRVEGKALERVAGKGPISAPWLELAAAASVAISIAT